MLSNMKLSPLRLALQMPLHELLQMYDRLVGDWRRRQALSALADAAPGLAFALAIHRSAMGCEAAQSFLLREGRKRGGRELERLVNDEGTDLLEEVLRWTAALPD